MTTLVQLKSLAQQQWDAILETRIPDYAEEQTRSGRWSEEEALEKATEEFDKMLSDGVKTAKNHVHGIIDQASDETAGYLWYVEREKAGKPNVFICDLQIFEAYRRRGLASAALLALDEIVQREHGTQRIELHVFGSNHPARALYTNMDYEETNVIMAKNLA